LKKIGLLGGSFDPPHRGHLYISLEAKKILNLDEVWWLITPQNPLKISKPAKYSERLRNSKKITKNMPITIKEIEKKIKSKYSYETIKYLKNHYKNIKFFWLMGADNLINFHQWQKWQKIIKDMPIVIFRRYGYNTKALKSTTSNIYKNFRINKKKISDSDFNNLPAWVIVENKEIKISSTEIRKQRKLFRGRNY
tara:strand:+ start:329 stop:913 length:585 start_codon:yes stop_codon:yes gene_type:complete